MKIALASWMAVTASVSVCPSLLAVLAVVVLGGALVGVHPFWHEPDLTLAEAAALNDLGTIQRLIWEGVDPNAPTTVRPRILRSEALVVTPLQAAVGTRTPRALQFLLSRGARMDAEARTVLLCLALKDDAREIVA